MMKLQRNDRCPCGSGKKYKKCCYLDSEKNAEIIRAASLAATAEEMAELLSMPMKVYRLKVVLVRMRHEALAEEVSRTFAFDGRDTLYDLHSTIQLAFGWDQDHMFSFFMSGELFDRSSEYSGDPMGNHIVAGLRVPTRAAAKTQLRDLDLSEHSTFLYLFDYGDELVHEITVEAIRDRNDEDRELPVMVDAVGTPPPQYPQMEA